TKDPQDPARRNYLLWRQERLFELCRLWDAEIRKVNPNARFIPNSGGGAMSDLDMKTMGETAETLFADRQARSGLAVPWASGKNGKEYRAALGNKPIGGIFSVGVEEPYRWKDSVQSEAEIRIWVADAVANGLRPWFTKFAAALHDRRWLGVVERLYTRLQRWEPYLRNEAPLARVAVVYSQQTATFYGGERAREKVEDPILGVYHALLEARIPFEMVHDRLLGAEDLNRFKTLVLPNVAALSDEQCEQLKRYVKRGGSIVATYETSRYNEWGERREDFGLAEVFGVSVAGGVQGPMKNAYLNVAGEPMGRRHPLLAGLEAAGRTIHGVYRLPVTATVDFPEAPLTLVPPYPDLPMEEVYPRTPKTDTPEVYLRELGGSRIVYFPWDIDRVFWEILNADHGTLLSNAVAWATNEERPVTVTGPGIVDVTVWRQKDSMTVHLVNLTNPMMMKGPFRELIPIGAQRLRVRLPAGAQVKGVKLLAQEFMPQIAVSVGYLELTVPAVLDHEIVAIDFEPPSQASRGAM
ncbi:MAG: beta-galactosidase trimerization domain-containing protein, partial [Deinococcota bacterium]|nr:beta-galactosidase trimerization domain-containing protein [Deinococcota bacterium]